MKLEIPAGNQRADHVTQSLNYTRRVGRTSRSNNENCSALRFKTSQLTALPSHTCGCQSNVHPLTRAFWWKRRKEIGNNLFRSHFEDFNFKMKRLCEAEEAKSMPISSSRSWHQFFPRSLSLSFSFSFTHSFSISLPFSLSLSLSHFTVATPFIVSRRKQIGHRADSQWPHEHSFNPAHNFFLPGLETDKKATLLRRHQLLNDLANDLVI